jgi:hypothetical protein
MRENDGVAPPFQFENGVDVVGEDGPFLRRDDTTHAFVKRGGGGRDGNGCNIHHINTHIEYNSAIYSS